MENAMRTATIRIRPAGKALESIRAGFVDAWNKGEYAGEHFDFESPAALFRALTPKRWALIERLQAEGPLGVRALARALERDVKRVHEDAKALEEYGFIERTSEGKLIVPFAEIHADFVMRAAA
jgi:predicted transcriptional regulator